MGYLETLDEWRKTRDASLVEVLTSEAELAARAHPVARKPPRDADAFHAVWMELAVKKQPADTPWLVHTLTEKIETHRLKFFAGGHLVANRWHQRSSALLSHAPNPLLAIGGLRVLRGRDLQSNHFNLNGGDTFLYGPAFALIRAAEDPGVRGAIEALIARFDETTREGRFSPRMHEMLTRFIRQLPAPKATEKKETEEKETEEPKSPTRSETVSERTLREAIYENPDDDGPRLVFADWLLERNDPLGELITLQCSKVPPTKKTSTRVSSLVRTYKDLWLGELATVITDVEFRRGFLASFGIAENDMIPASEWRRLATSPALRTVEEIRMTGRGTRRICHLFTRSAQATNLRILHYAGSDEMGAIARGSPRRIETLVSDQIPSASAIVHAFGTSSGLPRLDRLITGHGGIDPVEATIRWEKIGRLRERSMIPRFECLDAVLPFEEDNENREVADAFERIASVFVALRLRHGRFSVEQCGLDIEMQGASLLRIRVDEPVVPELGPFLRRFGQHGFARVDILATPEARDSIQRLFPRVSIGELEAPAEA